VSIRPFDGTERCNTPLTDEQRAALTEAFEEGYYEIPRRQTISEIADTLDISHQALSERLCRAHSRVVETQLALADGGRLGSDR
jgi:predicted DNA binding protein